LRQLHSRLQEDYWFLGNSAGPARHESLRTAIGWSRELCTPAEWLTWARLSVFRGSFQLRDAAEVCADRQLPGHVVRAAVSALAAQSVLAMDQRAGRQVRFRLPATIRAYGADMLRELGEGSWQRQFADKEARRGTGG
jgi:predicted ATPase